MRRTHSLSFILAFVLLIFFHSSAFSQTQSVTLNKFIKAGLPKKQFFRFFPMSKARTYRNDGPNTWVSYNYPLKGLSKDIITFHLEDKKLVGWTLNDRHEVAVEYLSEFASGNFPGAYPKIFQALLDVLKKLPLHVFMKVTDRGHPVVFIDTISTGIARYANSLEYYVRDEDPPAFKSGFYMIKLGDELNDAADVESIEGIIFHELAHDYLGHLRQPKFSCDMEREANGLVKDWGFDGEFQKAKEAFGAKKTGDSPCSDEAARKKQEAEAAKQKELDAQAQGISVPLSDLSPKPDDSSLPSPVSSPVPTPTTEPTQTQPPDAAPTIQPSAAELTAQPQENAQQPSPETK